MSRIENTLAAIFGGIFIALSGWISIEVLARKLLGVSLQGANELGGYALAVGATLAFTLALFGRNHIRVDVFYERLSAGWQAALNWFSSVLMASLQACWVCSVGAWCATRWTIKALHKRRGQRR
ncbi:TRAP transporter small permease subunit [Pseudomonas sp.]|uniref:TRAP transporter small permease subunit n=1 Tax=Pseudomonas sp. TaxID=306 RepID=UPI00257B39CF|nr:TRAP transporter small permease subunit [Pseudomonas sp.]